MAREVRKHIKPNDLGRDNKETIAALKRALKKQPGNLDLLSNLGLAQAQMGRMKDAVLTFTAAVKVAPDNAMFLSNLGASYQEIGRFDKAETSYRRAIALEPGNAELHFNLGTVMGSAQDSDGAKIAYGRATELDPSHFHAFKNLGNLFSTCGDVAAATTALQAAVSLQPDDMETLLELAWALTRQGKGSEAIAIFRKRLAVAAPTINVLDGLVFAHMVDGDPGAALEVAEKCLALSPGWTTGMAFKAIALNELGREDEAEEVLGLEHFLECTQIVPPGRYKNLEAFNGALIKHIQNHPTLRYTSTNRSLFDGRCTGNLLGRAQGPFAEFERLVMAAVKLYRESISGRLEHPFVAHQPTTVGLFVWANIMDERGYHNVHFHTPSWLSGIYYPSANGISQADDGLELGGWLELGGTYSMVPSAAKPKLRHVQPRPGLMVLFPSFVGHRTVPTQGPTKRISIAFDVTPVG